MQGDAGSCEEVILIAKNKNGIFSAVLFLLFFLCCSLVLGIFSAARWCFCPLSRWPPHAGMPVDDILPPVENNPPPSTAIFHTSAGYLTTPNTGKDKLCKPCGLSPTNKTPINTPMKRTLQQQHSLITTQLCVESARIDEHVGSCDHPITQLCIELATISTYRA